MTWKASGGNAVDAAQLPLVSGAISWRRRNRSRWPAPRGHHHAIHQCLVTERNRLHASGAERERIGRFTETYRGVCAIRYSAYPPGTDSRATSRDSWGSSATEPFGRERRHKAWRQRIQPIRLPPPGSLAVIAGARSHCRQSGPPRSSSVVPGLSTRLVYDDVDDLARHVDDP